VGRTWISVPFGVVALSSSAGMVAITSSDEWNLSFSFSFSCASRKKNNKKTMNGQALKERENPMVEPEGGGGIVT
jgi:HKD family nuclease